MVKIALRRRQHRKVISELFRGYAKVMSLDLKEPLF